MKRRKYETLHERLIANTYEPESSIGCWVWKSKRDRWGYGRLNLHYKGERPKTVMAHVAMARLFNMDTEGGRQIDHLCRNPSCINPDHLEVVTPSVNMQRRSEARRLANL